MPASIEEIVEDEERCIDHAPGDVAPDDGDDQIARFELPRCREQAGPKGEGERHDEPAQHLPQGFTGIEIAVDGQPARHVIARRAGRREGAAGQYFVGTIL
jgi:hypothetical protein